MSMQREDIIDLTDENVYANGHFEGAINSAPNANADGEYFSENEESLPVDWLLADYGDHAEYASGNLAAFATDEMIPSMNTNAPSVEAQGPVLLRPCSGTLCPQASLLFSGGALTDRASSTGGWSEDSPGPITPSSFTEDIFTSTYADATDDTSYSYDASPFGNSFTCDEDTVGIWNSLTTGDNISVNDEGFDYSQEAGPSSRYVPEQPLESSAIGCSSRASESVAEDYHALTVDHPSSGHKFSSFYHGYAQQPRAGSYRMGMLPDYHSQSAMVHFPTAFEETPALPTTNEQLQPAEYAHSFQLRHMGPHTMRLPVVQTDYSYQIPSIPTIPSMNDLIPSAGFLGSEMGQGLSVRMSRKTHRAAVPYSGQPLASTLSSVTLTMVADDLCRDVATQDIMCLYNGCPQAVCAGLKVFGIHLRSAHDIPAGKTKRNGEIRIGCLWPDCTESLSGSEIMRHIQTDHSGVSFKCRQCNTIRNRSDLIASHIRNARGHQVVNGVDLWDEVHKP
ncbi:hypothetical protein BDZ97DRAFT_1914372 [Flammula alnicola]|nr:hypothetical protein BDZ97DRAFT_1914372 [Flammula alnicola]